MNSIDYELTREIEINPLFDDYTRRVLRCMEKGIRFNPKTVHDVLGERLAVMHAWLHQVSEQEKIPLEEICKSVGSILIEGIPFFWKRDKWELALDCEVPDHIVNPGFMPYPSVWWSFERGIERASRFDAQDRDVEKDQLMGIWLREATNGIEMTVFSGHYRIEDLGLVLSLQIEFGAMHFKDHFPTTYSDDPLTQKLVADILNASAFLESHYAVSNAVRLNPYDGKHFNEVDRESDNNIVRFIDLRTPESHRHSQGDNPVNWSCHWKVKAHNRKQWCPSTKTHKLIRIQWFIKGDLDKPLKQSVYRVIR